MLRPLRSTCPRMPKATGGFRALRAEDGIACYVRGSVMRVSPSSCWRNAYITLSMPIVLVLLLAWKLRSFHRGRGQSHLSVPLARRCWTCERATSCRRWCKTWLQTLMGCYQCHDKTTTTTAARALPDAAGSAASVPLTATRHCR